MVDPSRIRARLQALSVIPTAVVALVLANVAVPVTAVAGTPDAGDLAQYVHPFVGTKPGGPDFGTGGGAANTFPGADVPFGMVQWSPDTVTDQSGGYFYGDNHIRGFSLTHFSGAGCDAAEDIPFLPYSGAVTASPATAPATYVSTFSHDNESASAGYYSVKLDSGITTQLTAAQHSGMGQLSFPTGKTASLLIGTSMSINGTTDALTTIDPATRTVSGWAASGGFCGGSNKYKVYFTATFDRPFASLGTWHNDTVTPGASTATGGSKPGSVLPAERKLAAGHVAVGQPERSPNVSVSGTGSGGYVTFDVSANQTVNVRVGLSYVSVDNAKRNVTVEQGDKPFTTIAQQARDSWNARLREVQVQGGTLADKQTFYTALYHSLLHPNVFSDVNGEYIGFDNKIHNAGPGHAQYANFSGWDIYRSQAQLLALLAPHEASDIAQSLYNQAHQAGDVWDRWSQNNDFQGVMNGDPYHVIITDMYAFGANDFDLHGALASMIKGATTIQDPKTARYVERPGLADYLKLGYVPGDPSSTLEYNAADFAIATLATELGDDANYRKFMARAQTWETLYNPATGYLEPRDSAGAFPATFDPGANNPFTEGNGAQYTWNVPFNLKTLFQVMGGPSKVVPRLDNFFSKLNAGPNQPYAFLGNEPSLWSPYEYDYLGQPYKTQDIVRQALTKLYNPNPDGEAGNDDLGTMSAWYVWGALGMFPETPGTATLALASPLFTKAVIHRPTGQNLVINAPQATDSTYYVQSLKVDGRTTEHPYLSPSFVEHGGTLDYTLASTPNTKWGSAATDAPPSYTDGAGPFITAANPGALRIEPGGGTAAATLSVQNVSTDYGTTDVNWTATPPAGVTVTPSHGTITVPRGGTATGPISVSVAAGASEGYSTVPVALTTDDGTKLPQAAVDIVVAKKNSLVWNANNVGVADDEGSTPTANFDAGGWAYSAQALAAAGVKPGGTVTSGPFTFPWTRFAGSNNPDNIVAGAGSQILDLSGSPATATQLSFLGAGGSGSAQGTVTITYTDGTTQTAQVGLSDWALGGNPTAKPKYGNTVAVTMPYRVAGDGSQKQKLTMFLFATAPIPLQAGKHLASVTLPSTVTDGGQLHIFSYAVS